MEDDTQLAEYLLDGFAAQFGGKPDFVARAPGRVNLIGEHTDYNGGFVLPAAIDRVVLIAVRRMPHSREFRLHSLDYYNDYHFTLDELKPTNEPKLAWANYIQGVVWALDARGYVSLKELAGAEIVIAGNVPRGSGLSSSAALEVAAALAIMRLADTKSGNESRMHPYNLAMDRVKLALACQKAENEYVGVKSGIMDQFISALGQPDAALLIDTRSLGYEAVPLGLEELGYRVVVVDSAVPRTLGSTAYNQRRAECEEAVKVLAPGLNLGANAQLRDVSLEQFNAHADWLADPLRQRAKHVISEDARTIEAVGLMRDGFSKANNLARFGELLYASHASLRDDYQVSCKELDLLVELARQTPGVVGARMVGAGFGGCTLHIVQERHLADFERQVVNAYRHQTKLNAAWHVCQAVQGGNYL